MLTVQPILRGTSSQCGHKGFMLMKRNTSRPTEVDVKYHTLSSHLAKLKRANGMYSVAQGKVPQ